MTANTGPSAGLTLLAPGLFGPVPLLPEQAPATPALDLLLSRAVAQGGAGGAPSLVQALLERFAAGASAPYARAADDPGWDGRGALLHADPVHLRADRDRLRLFDARHLGIRRAEADALTAEVNHLLEADGLRLVAPTPSRWYLEAAEPPAIAAVPLEQVAGRAIDGRLPEGAGAEAWAALMTEVQMLLHQSDVNRAREARGQPAINALWTWGGGRWQWLPAPQGLQRLCAEDALARGLAAAAGIASAGLAGCTPAPGTLVVVRAIAEAVHDADAHAWCQGVMDLEQRCAAALAALREGTIGWVALDLADGRAWRLTRAARRRFWRRGVRLAQRAALG